jgi:outer membrane protein OmpA-like peptidoglycan-associated protein
MSSRLVAVVLAVVFATTACAPPPPPPRPPGALAVVVGGTANMPAPANAILTDPTLIKEVDEAILSHDTLSVVEVSGKPRAAMSAVSLKGVCNDAPACEAEQPKIREQVQAAVAGVRASEPEADVLDALGVAAEQTASSPGVRHLIVIDNGLQTAGEFQLQGTRILFANDEVDLDALAKRLEDGHRISPALKGTTITWVGLASWTGQQKKVDSRPKANLQLLWTKILDAAGAKVTFAGGLQDGAPPAAPDLPAVAPVDLADTPVTAPDTCPTIFDDEIGFVTDKATFTDGQRAKDVLQPIAEGLINRQQRARLIGYVALHDGAIPRPLSLRRAEAVRDELVTLGVPSNLLVPVGGGLAPEASGAEEPPEKLAGYRRVEIRSGSCAE